MRTLSLAIFLMVAVHSIASASTAFASTAAETPVSTEAKVSLQADASQLEVNGSSQASLVQAERRPVRSEPQVLSSNFSRPKPVQIYWFFGGR